MTFLGGVCLGIVLIQIVELLRGLFFTTYDDLPI